ncbi:hypothetical protein UFRH6_53 [Pseudomonas phage UF_RH6]|nr:hypothetical protein UFRH6_53 [Pseudomonas phage UF_RH6]
MAGDNWCCPLIAAGDWWPLLLVAAGEPGPLGGAAPTDALLYRACGNCDLGFW